MIKESKCYTLLCDNCGEDVNANGDGILGWEDIYKNYKLAEEAYWEQIEGKWYCWECYVYDEQSNKLVVKTTGGKK